MSRFRWSGHSRALALILSLGMVVGCKDAVEPQEPNVLEGLKTGIHPIVVVASKSGSSAVVELHLRRVRVDASVASYQGEIQYDTKVLTLSGAEFPRGATGAWNEVSPGKVRFAGASLEGLADGAVLTLRFTTRGRGSILAEDFKLRMEEVVSTSGFKSLTSEMVSREQPLFSASPLRD